MVSSFLGGAMTVQETKQHIKQELNIKDDSKDTLIMDVLVDILNYCNLKELPLELHSFSRRKVEGIINYERDFGLIDGLDLKSIKLGDATVSIETNTSKSDVYGLSNSDKKYLRMFRRTRR